MIINKHCSLVGLALRGNSKHLQTHAEFNISQNNIREGCYKHSQMNCQYSIHRQLTNSLKFYFTRRSAAKQLILYSQQEVEKMHYSREKQSKKQNQDWTVIKQKNQKFRVSLVGLPNCGKSSLFNCLIGERMAIVDKQYGMTRDRRQFNILNGLVSLVDTPGVQVSLLSKSSTMSNPFNQSPSQSQDQLKQDIFNQTLKAITQSDMVILIIDSKKQAISQGQIMLAKYLKAFNNNHGKQGRKCQIVLVCNKCDGLGWDQHEILSQIYSKLPLYQNKFSKKYNFEQKQPKSHQVSQNSLNAQNLSINSVRNDSKQSENQKIFFCSAEQGTGIFEVLGYINQRIPYSIKEQHEKVRKQRRQKFEKLVKKMKQQIKQINQTIQNQINEKQKKSQEKTNKASSTTQSKQAPTPQQTASSRVNRPGKQIKKYKIKQWQKDFRQLNPNPQQNQQLDSQNYEDLLLRPEQAFSSNQRGVDIKNLRMKHSIKICFIGRPNVGKSSLINELLGQQKMIVSDIPHTTRDALTTKIMYKNRKIQIVDTAGLNTPRFDQNEQQYLRKSQISTMIHVQQSHVIVYVMDSLSAFKVDDFKLINRVIQQGRPIVIVVNKWQAIKEQYRNKARNFLISQIQKNLGQLNGHPLVFVSAKMLLNIDQMMDKIITTYDKWNKRISTGLLNNWLQKFKKLDNLPKDEQCTLKINYMIQARVRPPHFIMFVNNKDIFKNNYMRFLMRNIAQQFGLDGVPLRHTLRSTNNKQNEFKKWKKPNVKKPSKTNVKMEELKKKYGDFTI